jgi:Kef-type K+ transport system membrane component KefB
MADNALPYHEPDIITILILTSFLLLLNLVGYGLDRIIYCGLLGQIFIGVAWGTPGGHWLSTATQEVFVQLGYLGLILLVFEGGLSTNFKALKANIFLSIAVALTGIGAPIGLSFVLMAMVDATPLQAFAAGAALCSTSLGTTFTVLKTSGLTQSRLGVVLTSAAMLDDVVGLVMVQIISNLGAVGSFDAVTVVRPIGVSLAFALVVPLACWMFSKLLKCGIGSSVGKWTASAIGMSQLTFLVHTAILVGFVVASSYAGTSNLFAAYLAGACISWYDGKMVDSRRPSSGRTTSTANEDRKDPLGHTAMTQPISASAVVQSDQVGNRESDVIEPRMLPSPAASINGENENGNDEIEPKTGANEGAETDTDAMESPPTTAAPQGTTNPRESAGVSTFEKYYETPVSTILKPLFFASVGFSIPISQMFSGSVIWRGFVYAILMALGKLLCGLWLVRFSEGTKPAAGVNGQAKGKSIPRPKSLYPASILGCAMVARGEIGFLISAIAESGGVFSTAGKGMSSDLFMIVTWAIMLCTIGGSLAVGLLTRRVRRLQELERESSGGRIDPLGVWGVL